VSARLDYVLGDLPIQEGAVLVVGHYTFEQRLRHLIGRAFPRLKVYTAYLDYTRHSDGLTIVLSSLLRGPPRYFCIDDRIDGCITANSASVGLYVDALSGRQSEIRLPAIPDTARSALAALGIH
jgi:hypothetical protein